MKESARLERNTTRLKELNPVFARRIAAIISRLEAAGLRPRIQCAWRNPADQLAAYQAGTSKLKLGFHNLTRSDGGADSLAVDLLDDDHPAHEGCAYLLQLAAAAEDQRCVTGIRWGVPAGLASGIDAAIAAGDWEAPVKIGWDPAHVEPADVTLAEAKAGRRPRP